MNKTQDNLLLHPKTRLQTEYFLQKPLNSLLIVGESGSGKMRLAESLAAQILDIKPEALANHPFYTRISKPEDKQDISIDTIRHFIKKMSLKTTGTGEIRRVTIIENAHNLSLEAQNALLKILEEPNSDSLFILTAPNVHSLLPTTVSRCQLIKVHPVTMKQAERRYENQHNSRKISGAWQLSQGNWQLLDTLLRDDSSHNLKKAVEEAKRFLKLTTYERLITADTIARNREDFKLFLEAIGRVLAAVYRQSTVSSRTTQAKKVLIARKLVRKSLSAIELNGNLKLIYLDLALELEI